MQYLCCVLLGARCTSPHSSHVSFQSFAAILQSLTLYTACEPPYREPIRETGNRPGQSRLQTGRGYL